MALFQPTNVIPSSFTVGVVDALQDTASISWQVNGNSAMTAFEIKFMQNDGSSTQITTTGRVPVTGGFYGTDRFGQPQIYTWTAGGDTPQKWSTFYSAFTNGGQFKFKITQYWQEGGEEKSIEQIESSVFITRSRPECSIQRSERNDFINPTPFTSGSTLPASVGYFVGNYTQAQGAPVRDVRWRVATWVNGAAGEILADTGDVDTPTLQFEFNGFFIGNQYAVRCSGKADYQTYSTQDFDSGWTNFTVQLTDGQKQSDYTGNFTVECLPKENAALLNWEAIEVIPPATSPDGFNPSTSSGSVTLPEKSGETIYSVTWKEKSVVEDGEQSFKPINFATPWTVALCTLPNIDIRTERESVSGTTISLTEDTTVTVRDYTSFGAIGAQYTATLIPTDPYISYTSVTSGTDSYGKRVKIVDTRQGSSGLIVSFDLESSRPAYIKFNVSARVYVYKTTVTLPGKITDTSERILDGIGYKIDQTSDTALNVSVYGRTQRARVSFSFDVTYLAHLPKGKFFEIGGNDLSVGFGDDLKMSIYKGESALRTLTVPTTTKFIIILFAPNLIRTLCYDNNSARVYSQDTQNTNAQEAISSVTILGGDNGMGFGSVSVYQGGGTNLLSLYADNPAFEPAWNDERYTLYMTANFNGNLEGGTGTASGNGFRIYRREVGSNILTPIANLSSTETSLKDYGIRSRKAYTYSLYAYDGNQAFMKSVANDTVIATCFNSYSLLVCDYDSKRDAYHVRKQYLFALNLSEGSVGNNNSPTLNANFTAYPTRMPSTQNYASGTLQGLIGAIYTVPALIEQIGGFKHTAKPSTLDYFDSVDLEKELYELSTAPYQLFLRDMKGHLRMVATSGAISMTQDLKKRQLSTTISLPWVEIGDASDVMIIQTPDDYGWSNDNQVLDVRLDTDPATGVLSATYPKPYDGTKFYLTGAQKEILGAETPLGVTPAQFDLSPSAEEPDDGVLTATAKVNTEEGD